jgi:hypothetical protein
LAVGPFETRTQHPILMRPTTLLITLLLVSGLSFGQNAWINEIHYDNVSTDVDEVIEIVIESPGSYTLSDFEVYLYSGAVQLTYDNENLANFTVGNTELNYTFFYWYPTQVQNASSAPDGLALVYQGSVISGQFLSYEGTLTALDGPAAGLTSVDIGVVEGSDTPVGESLQLSGTGLQYSDFTWEPPATSTVGGLNNNQNFCPDCPRNFQAVATASDQIDLSWMQNIYGDDVMIAFNTSNTFGAPEDGTAYIAGNPITGGGTVIYNGSATTFNHTGLTSATHYYYMAWSVDGSVDYSMGVTADATTYPLVSAGAPGDVIITEVMQNPDDVADDDGEWFELYNTTASDINIDGWVISDNGSDSHTISNGGSLIITANGFLVLGRNGIIATNGGVPVDYEYASFVLANSDDEIILTSAAVEIDRIEYDGGPDWPDPAGASMTYIGLPGEDNNDDSKWTTAYAREAGYTLATSDRGSPKTNGLFQNLITTTTWTGTGNWSEGNPPAGASANWSNGSPGTAVQVIIDGTATVDMLIALPAVSADMNVLSGNVLTIDSGNGLIIYGQLTDEGGLVSVEENAELDVR